MSHSTQLLLKGDHVCCGDHACSRLEADLAEAAAIDVEFEIHSRRRLAALRYHVQWNAVLWYNLSQRACVGGSVTMSEDKSEV